MHLRPSPPSPLPPFAVAVDTDGRQARVTPRGELDVATVPPLERAVAELCEQDVTDVVLDLRELTFFDSTALCLLLRLDARMHDERRRLALVVGDGIAARVLDLTRTRGRFRCDEADRG